jgi:hypothetical protein
MNVCFSDLSFGGGQFAHGRKQSLEVFASMTAFHRLR